MRRSNQLWLNPKTHRPLPAVRRAPLVEAGPIKSPLESNSAPSTATAQKQKVWVTSRSCLAQASVRNGKRAISKSPAPVKRQASRQVIIEQSHRRPRRIQYRAAAPRDKKNWSLWTSKEFEGIPLWATKLD